jgi:hypothetical protein
MERPFSDWKPIRADMPQGVILASLLYNIYVADILRRPRIEISQFADDTAAYTSDRNINYAGDNLQRYMSDLESWLYKWKIKINTKSSTAIIFTKRRKVPRNTLELFEQEIPWSAQANYLGVHLERTWKAHIEVIEYEAMQRFLLRSSIFKSRTLNTKKKLICTNY